MSYELYHHGIRGQHWGVRHGPPYPLKGGNFIQKKYKAYRKRKSIHDINNKRHFDQTISTKDTLATLSYDPNRTKNTDMFYAAYKPLDKHQYNALFNKKISTTLYDDDGNAIGTGDYYKYRIKNKVNTDMKIASEDSGAKAFRNLYKNDRDFYNFVTDPDRMQAQFVTSKYKFRGYREARKSLEKIRSGDKEPTADDLQKVYRMFNYVIPADGGGNTRVGKDVATQRAKLFKALKEAGYGGLLDTNDAIYGGFKATAPVIVFDMENVTLQDIGRVSASDKKISELAFLGRKVLGL